MDPDVDLCDLEKKVKSKTRILLLDVLYEYDKNWEMIQPLVKNSTFCVLGFAPW
jgi:uncharacterized protein YeeX (DUF496 family)